MTLKLAPLGFLAVTAIALIVGYVLGTESEMDARALADLVVDTLRAKGLL